MAWSTRQLAELAGTTVKAVRHYHEVGVLEEPERKTNGYKQYQVRHLLRLLQIRRLRELGVPLEQIASMGRPDGDSAEVLRVLDAELEETIARLQRVRDQLAFLFEHHAPADIPSDFSSVAGEMSEADRSLIMIYSRIFDEPAMNDLRRLLEDKSPTDADTELDDLPADADADAITRLAQRLAPQMVQLADYPEWRDAGATTPQAQNTVVAAMSELYNPAQLEALRRAYLIGTGQPDDQPTQAEDRG